MHCTSPAAQVSNVHPTAELSAHTRTQLAPASQVTASQSSPRQSKRHVLPVSHVTAQLPLVQLKSQALPCPQRQAEPRQSPEQAALSPSQTIAQLPPMQSKAQVLPMPHVQSEPLHSPLHGRFPPSQLTAQLPLVH
jgi:hypothetical protein